MKGVVFPFTQLDKLDILVAMVWLGYIELKWYSHRVGDSCPNIVLNFGLFAPSCPLFLPLASFKKPHGGVEVEWSNIV